MTPAQDLLPCDVPDLRDLPLDADIPAGDEEHMAVMRRIGLTGDEPGTSVSAFNSSI